MNENNLSFDFEGYTGTQQQIYNQYVKEHGLLKGRMLQIVYMATPMVGINRITIENYEEFYKRARCLTPHLFFDEIALEDVEGLIGLRSNAKLITNEDFYSQLPPKKLKTPKIKTSDLSVKQTNFVVAHLEGLSVDEDLMIDKNYRGEEWAPCTDWSQGGPIIERESIHLMPFRSGIMSGMWEGSKENKTANSYSYTYLVKYQIAGTPLKAAMKSFVASRLGEEVDMEEIYKALGLEVDDIV